MKNISWRKRFFLSYIFVGAIPLLLLGTFFYYGNRLTSKQEMERTNSAMLSQVLQKLDYVSEKMNSAAYHFSGSEMEATLNDVRNQAIAIDEGMVVSQLETYSEIIGDTGSAINTILYLRGDKYIYTMDGRIPYSIFEENMKQYGDLNLASFFRSINATKNDVRVKLSGGKYFEGEQMDGQSMVYFLYPIPYMNNIPIATLGFGFDVQSMENLVRTYYTTNSQIYIFDEIYQNIFCSSPEGFSEETMKALSDLALQYRRTGQKLAREEVNGKPFIVTREMSANSGLAIISITDEKEFYQYESSFASWFFFLVGILIVAGVIFAVMLSKSNYEPIHELVQKIVGSGDDAETPGKGVNEFEMIVSHWNEIQNKNEELIALVNRQRPMVVASCLRRILKGKFKTTEEMNAMLHSANINLGYAYNFVILLPVPVEDNSDEEKSLKIMRVLSDFMLPSIHVYGLDMLKDDGIAIIINCQEKLIGHALVDVRKAVAEQLKQELMKEYGIEIPFYIGRVYDNPLDINRSFLEATAIATDYKMLGNQKTILFEEIGYEEQNLQYPILEQALYIQCLKQANTEAALKALDNMITEIRPLKSFVITQCLCFDIINITIKTLDQLKGFELKEVDLKKVITFGTLSEFHEKMIYLTTEFCRQFAEFKDSRNNELKSRILDYVNRHFGDSSMGLDVVAAEFGVSANYLSRFFKQETGCSFIQYVTMVRMDRAKELLINGDRQVKEIVAEIGYIDVANFVRKFKGYEGVTPGQYREKMRLST